MPSAISHEQHQNIMEDHCDGGGGGLWEVDEKRKRRTRSTHALRHDTEGMRLLATLPDRLESVEATDKLVSSPAVVVDAESAMWRMMAMVAQQAEGGAASITAAKLR